MYTGNVHTASHPHRAETALAVFAQCIMIPRWKTPYPRGKAMFVRKQDLCDERGSIGVTERHRDVCSILAESDSVFIFVVYVYVRFPSVVRDEAKRGGGSCVLYARKIRSRSHITYPSLYINTEAFREASVDLRCFERVPRTSFDIGEKTRTSFCVLTNCFQ